MTTKKSSTVLASVILGAFATLASGDDLPPSQQNALVRKYCAVCHTDAANNGGLSLEHYDATRNDPPLAAMLLSKLRNGAMGAAGLGVPDKETQAAWIAATVRQASAAERWMVTHTEPSSSRESTVTASVVRRVPPRKAETEAPLYRLTVSCDGATRQGTMLIAWSPEPQTNRTFLVSTDGQPGVPHALTGQEKMGNGTTGTSGRASATLRVPLPEKSLTIAELFPGETVVFSVDALDLRTRRELAACERAVR
jgi:hypothetical protein